MGNFTNIIIIFASISLVAGLVVMMSQDISAQAGVSYQSQYFGDYLFSQYDLTAQYVNGTQTSSDWNVIKTSMNESDLPSQSATGSTSSSAIQFPDWLQSGWRWVTSTVTAVVNGVATPVRGILNVVGIPYTIIKGFNTDARALAILSGYLSTILSIVLVMFLLGREN